MPRMETDYNLKKLGQSLKLTSCVVKQSTKTDPPCFPCEENHAIYEERGLSRIKVILV